MTMPPKDELIENIAIDFCNNDAGVCNLKANKELNRDICTKDNCYPVKYATICLQAMLKSLPDSDYHENYYDLLQMKN